jgi:hypothetical protein
VTTRPDSGRPGRLVPSGFELIAVPDPDWRLVTNGVAGVPGRQCRLTSGRKACGKAAVARVHRSFRRRKLRGHWWSYCAEHMYGRWIENGVVMVWHLVESDPKTCPEKPGAEPLDSDGIEKT